MQISNLGFCSYFVLYLGISDSKAWTKVIIVTFSCLENESNQIGTQLNSKIVINYSYNRGKQL